MMSCTSDLSRMNSFKVKSLTSILSRLDDFNAFKSIYLEQFWVSSMQNSEFRPWFWTSRMIKWLQVGLTKSSKIWPLSWTSRAMSLVPPVFDLECQGRSNGFEWARRGLQNFKLDLEHRGRWAWFNPFDLSSLSRYFIWTSIISSGVVVVADWLEVVTLSQIQSSRPFRLAHVRVMNCPIQLTLIRT